MSPTSSSRDVSGFFVNHFGGRWSAEYPLPVRPFTSSSMPSTRCGTAVMVDMPNLKGMRVRMFWMRRSISLIWIMYPAWYVTMFENRLIS